MKKHIKSNGGGGYFPTLNTYGRPPSKGRPKVFS